MPIWYSARNSLPRLRGEPCVTKRRGSGSRSGARTLVTATPKSEISAEDASAELSRREEAATAAGRELAAELATVCALVEKEEARRETLRAAFVSAGDASPGGTEPAAADDAVVPPRAASGRRAWRRSNGGCARRRARLRPGTRRPRRSSARRPGGIGTRSGAMRAARAAGERREAAIADRLARPFAARTPRRRPRDRRRRVAIRKTRSSADPRSRAWGAGPGLKAAPSGSKAVSRRHAGSQAEAHRLGRRRSAASTRFRVGRQRRTDDAATRAPPGVPPAGSARSRSALEGGARRAAAAAADDARRADRAGRVVRARRGGGDEGT